MYYPQISESRICNRLFAKMKYTAIFMQIKASLVIFAKGVEIFSNMCEALWMFFSSSLRKGGIIMQTGVHTQNFERDIWPKPHILVRFEGVYSGWDLRPFFSEMSTITLLKTPFSFFHLRLATCLAYAPKTKKALQLLFSSNKLYLLRRLNWLSEVRL